MAHAKVLATTHPLYEIWRGMKARCNNERSPDYRLYGARGVQVCAEWATDFWKFAADVGERPAGKSIDRIDSDKGYEPGNVRWATPIEQTGNRRVCRRITIEGRTQTLFEWAAEKGLKSNTVVVRILNGWSPEAAITRPVGARRSTS